MKSEEKVSIETMTGVGKRKKIAGREYMILPVNIKDMCFAPKILIFTKNKHDFVMTSRIQNNTFYNFGGVYDRFDDIIEFLRAETQSKLEIKKADNVQLTFEYIDNKQKLILPLFFKT